MGKNTPWKLMNRISAASTLFSFFNTFFSCIYLIIMTQGRCWITMHLPARTSDESFSPLCLRLRMKNYLIFLFRFFFSRWFRFRLKWGLKINFCCVVNSTALHKKNMRILWKRKKDFHKKKKLQEIFYEKNKRSGKYLLLNDILFIECHKGSICQWCCSLTISKSLSIT